MMKDKLALGSLSPDDKRLIFFLIFASILFLLRFYFSNISDNASYNAYNKFSELYFFSFIFAPILAGILTRVRSIRQIIVLGAITSTSYIVIPLSIFLVSMFRTKKYMCGGHMSTFPGCEIEGELVYILTYIGLSIVTIVMLTLISTVIFTIAHYLKVLVLTIYLRYFTYP